MRFFAAAFVAAFLILAGCASRRTLTSVDLSSPELAMNSFMKACLNNDPAAVEATIHVTEPYAAFRHDFALWLTAQTHLDAAIFQKFGRLKHDELMDSWTEPLEFAGIAAFKDGVAALPSSDIQVDGNHATITGGSRMNGIWLSSESLRCVKINGHWLIDLDAMRTDPNAYTLTFPSHYPPRPGQPTDVSTYAYHGAKVAKEMNRLADQIESGRLTAEQTSRELARLKYDPAMAGR